MLARIALFELRFQLRSALFWISTALFFLLSFASVTIEGVTIGGRGNTHLNSPFALAQTVAVMTVFGVFALVAFVAGAVVRDDDTGFAPILHTTRVTKRAYVVGRFAGAALVAYLVVVSVAAGVLVGSWMPWLDPDKVGPFRPGDYAWVLLVLALPTVLAVSAGFFALATGTRSMTATYVGAVAFLALFFTAAIALRDPAWEPTMALLDPFGMGALETVTKYWTTAERNGRLPALAGPILVNRAVWLGVAAVLFAVAYRAFRFEARPARAARREPGDAPTPAARATLGHRVTPAFGARTAVAQLLELARFEASAVLRSPVFYVLLVLGVLNAFAALWTSTERLGAELYPVTRTMVNQLEGAFTMFPVLIAVYYSGELVWRDRERRVHELTGATPAPDWAFLLPKVAAVSGVLAATTLAGVGAGVLVQALKGWRHFELSHYLTWFVVPTIVGLLLVAVLTVFVQSIAPSKATGWALMLLYVVSRVALSRAGFEHVLYRYASTPPTPLSDMNGAGRFWIGAAWLLLYWVAFAVVLLVLAHALRRRGADEPLASRLRALPRRLAGPAGLVAAGAGVLWVATGAWIWFNTNVLNPYLPEPARDRRIADVERALLPWEAIAPPTITDVTLDVAVYPREVRAVTRGAYRLENRTGAPIEKVLVRWDLRLRVDALAVEGARLEAEDARLHYRVYRFERPLPPGAAGRITFATTLEERGFPADQPLTRIVENGTFLDNTELAPLLGFWPGEDLLQDRAKRRKYGLGELPRPPKLEDASGRAHHYLRHDSDWVSADLTLTTDADQVPVAPGYVVETFERDGRRTLHTRTEAPIHHFFSLQSARYAQRTERAGGVELAVLYHPDHAYNVDRMLLAMRRSLELFQRSFSPYQFRQLRILEFPAYATFAQSFANTIPFSESIGFVANASDPEKVDLATYVTAHEVAHQWFAHQVMGADMQGGTLLVETLAQYGAMLVMEDLYGKAQVRRFLKSELDRYLKARGSELVEELPLARVENQGYIHYQKGTLVMAWLREVVGQAAVDRAIRRLLAEHAFRPAPYPTSVDLIRLLREEAGPAHDALITDLFERITLYDLTATGARAVRRADGRWDVTISVNAAKKYADGKGVETEAPMDEQVEIGAFDAEPGKPGFGEGNILSLERRRVTSGAQTFTAVVDRPPTFVGIDPFNKRIDRNSDDNLVRPAIE